MKKKSLLSNFLLLDIINGLLTTLKYISHKPITQQYPRDRAKFAARFRGAPLLTVDAENKELCNGCTLCATACPVKCIEIKPTGKGVERIAETWDIDISRCMFCGLCVEVCPKKCLQLSEFFEISEYSQDKFKYKKEDLYKKREYIKYRK